MKKLLSIKAVSFVFAALMLFSGCTTTGESSGLSEVTNIITLNNRSEPGSLHPGLARGSHDAWIIDHMFEGLFFKGPNGIELSGAEAYETSDDGLIWTFNLNPNKRWSNGDVVTAHDYVTAWLFVLDPTSGSRYSSKLYIIRGAEEFNSNTDPSLVEYLREEVAIRAIDDFTFEIELIHPVTYLPDLLTHYTFYPIHTETQLEHPDWFTSPENFISNGGMYLYGWRHREVINLRANPYYIRADEVSIEGIDFLMINDQSTEWQMYQQGEIDLVSSILPSVVAMLIEEDYPNLYISPALNTTYYIINTNVVPLNNTKVRNALALSIDREAITTNITQGGQVPATTLTSHALYTPDGIQYIDFVGQLFEEDFDLARELLEEGLSEEGMTVEDFSISILYNTSDFNRRVAEAIQIMWIENLGIDVTLENAEFQVTLDRRSRGDFEIARAGWRGDYVDPMTFLEMLVSNSPHNDSGFSNPEYDRLISAAMQETDELLRMEILREAETLLISEMPIIPLFYGTNQIVTRPHITGVFTPVNKLPVVTFARINS